MNPVAGVTGHNSLIDIDAPFSLASSSLSSSHSSNSKSDELTTLEDVQSAVHSEDKIRVVRRILEQIKVIIAKGAIDIHFRNVSDCLVFEYNNFIPLKYNIGERSISNTNYAE